MIVDEEVMTRAPLSRSRFLAAVGTALTGAAAALWFSAEVAEAGVPEPCYGLNACSSCSGATCTVSGCKRVTTLCHGANGCWISCAYEGSTLTAARCCDWVHGSTDCICRLFVPSSNC